MKIINGNILEIKKGVIIHQVNNCGIMNACIAKDIRNMYPRHYNDYMNDYKINIKKYGHSSVKYYNSYASIEMLGDVVKTAIDKQFGILGICAQNGLGTKSKYTNENAFEVCLNTIAELYKLNPNVNYYMPYGIGCGLAGGDWSVISKLIETKTPFITLIKKGER